MIIATFSAIPIALLKILLKSGKLAILGVLVVILLFALCFYMIMVNAALMGLDKSNDWTFSYVTSWLIDTFSIETLISFFRLKLFSSLIGSSNKMGIAFRNMMSNDKPLMSHFADYS